MSARQAAYDIAEGLARILSFADEPTNPRYEEGKGMLVNGIEEALEFLAASPEGK
jgi:hypothetical protein